MLKRIVKFEEGGFVAGFIAFRAIGRRIYTESRQEVLCFEEGHLIKWWNLKLINHAETVNEIDDEPSKMDSKVKIWTGVGYLWDFVVYK